MFEYLVHGWDRRIAVTPLVPVALFGWVFVVIGIFFYKKAQEAVVASVIIGFLFLPIATFDLQGMPQYNKFTSISLGLILGSILTGQSAKYPLNFGLYDLPMFLWCFVAPFASSLSNGLGLYDGFASMASHYLKYGVFFWAGRRYFCTPSSLRVLTRGILIGGLAYFPLVIFEARMSPQISNIVYGFIQDTSPMRRYGGWRPVIFMEHGLMVSLWMAISATVAFWLWKSHELPSVCKIPIELLAFALIGAALLCKSGNGWFFLAAGIGGYYCYKISGSTLIFRCMLMIIPLYIAARLLNIISVERVRSFAGMLFDEERIESLTVRLMQEDLFGQKAMQRLLFGWGRMGRGWPVDPLSGDRLIQMVDSLWVILLSGNGLFGMSSLFMAIGIGPWKVLGFFKKKGGGASGKMEPYQIDGIILSLIVGFFLIDSLLNAMVSPIYVLCSGALVSCYSRTVEDKMCQLAPAPEWR
jgi:hypothetical protein